jgi:hypothetical protein
MLAQTLARALSSMLPRTTAAEMPQCLTGSGRGAGDPGASRDDADISLDVALGHD